MKRIATVIKVSFVILTILILCSFNRISKNDEGKYVLESEKNSVGVFKNTVNSVVNVSSMRIARSFWEFKEVKTGAGTGFVWDNKGHIITNYHVVHNGGNFVISFHNDKNQYRAKVIGAEPMKDVAVLKLQKLPPKLYPIKVGTSKNLHVGQKAIAIGNPFGLDHTMTSGIVSALGRSIQGIAGNKIDNMIQTDASINPGNSGGPLLNSSGELIGMNTMIYSTSGASAGVGFSVPIDSIKGIIPQLIKHGRVIRPALGIVVKYNDQIRQRFNIKKGVVILAVDPSGAAGKAGLQGVTEDRRGYYLGDVLLEIAGKEVNSLEDIQAILNQFKVGDTIKVKYLRKKRVKETKLILKKLRR